MRKFCEDSAAMYPNDYLGCIGCRCSTHKNAFCSKCGQCYYCLMREDREAPQEEHRVKIKRDCNTVSCKCGKFHIWE
jgi:hypothetical protein